MQKKDLNKLVDRLRSLDQDDEADLVRDLIEECEELSDSLDEVKEQLEAATKRIDDAIPVFAITQPNGVTTASSDPATSNAILIPDEGTEL